MLWVLLTSFSLLHYVVATALGDKRWDDFVEKHSWAEVPKGWKFYSIPAADHLVKLRIGLREGNLDKLIEALYEVSDPAHESYGNHLSKEDTQRLVAPHPSSVTAVNEWFQHHNIDLGGGITRSEAGDWISLQLPVADVERMFNAKYGVYHHPETSEYVLRTLAYSLPRHLLDPVEVATYFSTLRTMRATSFLQPELDQHYSQLAAGQNNKLSAGACNNETVTPGCLRELYRTTQYAPFPAEGNSIGVAGYLEEWANYKDLQSFLSNFRPEARGFNFTTTLVNGGKDTQTKPGIEANLDIQYTVGLTYPIPNIYWSTGGSPPFNPDSATPTNTNEPYEDWLDFVLTQKTLPQTITTSYGDDEQTVPRDYATKVCNQFAQLGVRDVTALFASGDFGVGQGDCKNNDGTNKKMFQPSFPASCPYVTTVGGTVQVNPEKAVPFSGGGFSRYFNRPSYQNDAVQAYVSRLGNTYQGLYNKNGRAYPDVAAQASGFLVYVGGRISTVGGTSAACPTVAAIIALLNDARLASGKSSLGWINPLIYSNSGKGFNDIISGSNPGCGTDGFPAGKGWDPVTGWGTPDFLKLREVVG